MNHGQQYLDRVHNLNVYRKGDRRAPHKPLLLIAIAKLLGGERDLPFAEVEEILSPLLNSYAPPVKGRHQPELPYWHPQSDALWEIPDGDCLLRQKAGFPKMVELRASSGRLLPGLAEALLENPDLIRAVVEALLDEHFPESIHDVAWKSDLHWQMYH